MSTASVSARRSVPRTVVSQAKKNPAKKQMMKAQKNKTWKLTRRGRFIFRGLPVLTLLALIVLGALTFVSPFEAKAGDSLDQPAAVSVKVKSGQTLWDIAYQAEPQADTRDVVDRIMDVNDLKSTKIEAGQTLLIPLVSAK